MISVFIALAIVIGETARFLMGQIDYIDALFIFVLVVILIYEAMYVRDRVDEIADDFLKK